MCINIEKTLWDYPVKLKIIIPSFWFEQRISNIPFSCSLIHRKLIKDKEGCIRVEKGKKIIKFKRQND